MALSWPIPLSGFFEDLPISQVSFSLGTAQTTSETGGGDVIKHQLGARLWMGEVQLGATPLSDMAAIEARLALLEQPGASLLIYDRRKSNPRLDPAGATIAAASPVIASLSVDGRELALEDLPAGYVISQGDMLGFSYGSNPLRRALHRVVTGATADGTGATGLFEITPVIRPGAALGATVTLSRPVCKAVITEAQYGSGRSLISRGASFAWRQTLR
ncbi:hypothetical protein [Litorisediminicola beolgyonensis]|uniref:Uncharacterized protein n=1 Tax=Litorisediminicola beolgyonensis TaxID=1173614 RepID=A0ABW3ZJ23_9RHOB